MIVAAERADPFRVTEHERRIFLMLLTAALGSRLELRTGTYRHERAAFLCVTKNDEHFPVAILVRPQDVEHMRNSDLAPARRNGRKKG